MSGMFDSKYGTFIENAYTCTYSINTLCCGTVHNNGMHFVFWNVLLADDKLKLSEIVKYHMVRCL